MDIRQKVCDFLRYLLKTSQTNVKNRNKATDLFLFSKKTEKEDINSLYHFADNTMLCSMGWAVD